MRSVIALPLSMLLIYSVSALAGSNRDIVSPASTDRHTASTELKQFLGNKSGSYGSPAIPGRPLAQLERNPRPTLKNNKRDAEFKAQGEEDNIKGMEKGNKTPRQRHNDARVRAAEPKTLESKNILINESDNTESASESIAEQKKTMEEMQEEADKLKEELEALEGTDP